MNVKMMIPALALLLAGAASAEKPVPVQVPTTPSASGSASSQAQRPPKIPVSDDSLLGQLQRTAQTVGGGGSSVDVPNISHIRRAYKNPKEALQRFQEQAMTLKMELQALEFAASVKGLPKDAARYLRRAILEHQKQLLSVQEEIEDVLEQLNQGAGGGPGCKGPKCGDNDGNGGTAKPETPATPSTK